MWEKPAVESQFLSGFNSERGFSFKITRMEEQEWVEVKRGRRAREEERQRVRVVRRGEGGR